MVQVPHKCCRSKTDNQVWIIDTLVNTDQLVPEIRWMSLCLPSLRSKLSLSNVRGRMEYDPSGTKYYAIDQHIYKSMVRCMCSRSLIGVCHCPFNTLADHRMAKLFNLNKVIYGISDEFQDRLLDY